MIEDFPAGLDRYVRPVADGLEGLLDEHGFLQLPAPDGLWFYGGSRPVQVADLAGVGSFVLLAPGGAGKTTVLDALRCREPTATAIDLSLQDKRGMHDELTAVISGGQPVYLDGLDVVAREEPAAMRIVQDHLTKPEARHIRWRMACRPAAWNSVLSAALRESLSGFQELALLPLTRTAAAAVARRVGTPEGFLDAIVGAKLGGLAASALRFQAAAEQWRDVRRLPESHLAAIDYEVTRMLAETGGDATPSLSRDRKYRIAMRLAAMAVFGSINRYARGSGASAPGLCCLEALPSVPEPDELGTPIGLTEYEAAIGTALFDAADGGSVTFRHQQYAEYLAARYVAERPNVTCVQVRELLRVGADGRVPGGLAGVVAWLAALRPALVEDLVSMNAHLLAQAGVEVPSDEVRAQVVAALLEAAAVGDSEPEWGFDLSGLPYSTLEEDLRRHLRDGLTDPAHVWWVARLAETGGCRGLAEMLLVEAMNNRWPIWARRPAVVAVSSFGDGPTTERLLPLLRLRPAEDPDDELLAAGIEALYPRLLSTSDLLAALRPRTNRDLVGAYLILLGQLADRIPAGDLPVALEWVARREDTDAAYGQFPQRLIEAGWQHVESPGVRASLARLVARLISSRSQIPWRFRQQLPWAGAAWEERRLLLTLVAEHLGDNGAHDLVSHGLATDDDIDYLIAELPELPTSAHAPLTAALCIVLHQPNRVQADLVLNLSEAHPAYEQTRDLRGHVRLDSALAQQRRRFRERELKLDHEDAERRERHRYRLAEALACARTDLGDWWKVAAALAEDGSSHDHYFTQDLTRRPGWVLLYETQRGQVFEYGLRYLETHEPKLAAEHLREIHVNEVLPDWSGVYLLTSLAAHRPETVRAFGLAVWQRWAPCIVTAWSNGLDESQGLRQDLLALAPPEARAWLAEAALTALKNHDETLPQYDIYRNLVPEIGSELGVRLTRGDYPDRLGQALLRIMVEQAPAVAREVCHRLRNAGPPSLTEAALSGLAALDPEAVVGQFEAGELCADEVEAVAPDLALTGLSDRSLSTLARLLLDRLPFTADPPWQEQLPWGRNARQTRGHVLDQLVSRGLPQTVAELCEGRPDTDRTILGAYLRRARRRAVDLAFRPVDPADLLTLLSRGDVRLVRSDRDLLDVVIETLRELQRVIRGGAYRDLWNLGDSSKPKSEDDISDWFQRHLAKCLGSGAVVGRELQVQRRHDQGIGTRIDLTAIASTATQPQHQVTVIAEAKLVNHDELFTAMRGQLVERYLEPTGLQCGIYLVYWVDPTQRPSWWRRDRCDPDLLLHELREQAKTFDPGLTIVPILIDISRSTP